MCVASIFFIFRFFFLFCSVCTTPTEFISIFNVSNDVFFYWNSFFLLFLRLVASFKCWRRRRRECEWSEKKCGTNLRQYFCLLFVNNSRTIRPNSNTFNWSNDKQEQNEWLNLIGQKIAHMSTCLARDAHLSCPLCNAQTQQGPIRLMWLRWMIHLRHCEQIQNHHLWRQMENSQNKEVQQILSFELISPALNKYHRQ